MNRYDLSGKWLRHNQHPLYWAALPLFLAALILSACGTYPDEGSFSASCSYAVRPDGRVDLSCLPYDLPDTLTPQPSPTITQTATLTATNTATPSPVASVPPSPTAVQRVGYPVVGVIRNNGTTLVRIRDCTGRSESNPYNCPQGKVIDKSTGQLVDYWFEPETAYRLWRVVHPFNTRAYIWAALTSDAAANRLWTSLCFGSTGLLSAYLFPGLTQDDDVMTIWIDLFYTGQAPVPVACFEPKG